ncbi:MAG: ATP-dependent protease subunit HslV [Ignavibacteria bacterium]|nr:ATP-dependent protease subunit HslV [Ignavibacteria bacterium]
MNKKILSTTVLGLTHNGSTVIGSDGQVTVGQTVMKHSARKVRRLHNDSILAGFAGSAADSFTLFARFEEQLEKTRGNVERAAVELAREWRTDKYLRHLEALLAVLSADKALVISGTGEVVEPDDGIVAIGSGGSYALAAARMLTRHSTLNAEEIVRESLLAAADICIYSNSNLTVLELQNSQ